MMREHRNVSGEELFTFHFPGIAFQDCSPRFGDKPVKVSNSLSSITGLQCSSKGEHLSGFLVIFASSTYSSSLQVYFLFSAKCETMFFVVQLLLAFFPAGKTPHTRLSSPPGSGYLPSCSCWNMFCQARGAVVFARDQEHSMGSSWLDR